MKNPSHFALLALLIGIPAVPASAAALTDADLMQAATELAHQYDGHYAAKDPAAMASLYAVDGVLVSPAGAIVRGREALQSYYTKRFAAGAHDHAIKILEAHVQGDGGYSLAQFSVTVPRADGPPREVHGSLVAVYRHDPDGWHLRLVEPSEPEQPAG